MFNADASAPCDRPGSAAPEPLLTTIDDTAALGRLRASHASDVVVAGAARAQTSRAHASHSGRFAPLSGMKHGTPPTHNEAAR
jgi:hypothetical protein